MIDKLQNDIIILDMKIKALKAGRIKAVNEGKTLKNIKIYNKQLKKLIKERDNIYDKIDELKGKKILKKIK